MNYSMNIGPQGVEQERDCVEMGYDNVTQYARKAAFTEPTVPNQKPTPLASVSIETSNTILVDVGPTAGDIVRRSRNG